MRRFFGNIRENQAFIEGEEFLHLKTVLRLKEGDDIIVLDGSSIEYVCKLTSIRKEYAIAEVLSKQECKGLPKKNIVLFQAFTKREKLELIVQKAVELGISKLILFSSDFTIAKDSSTKKERLDKIVRSACKQCECSIPMEIETCTFADMLKNASKLDIVLYANERKGEVFDFSQLANFDNIGIIVGPEGGFSEKEQQKIIGVKVESISLGNRILRSETASIVLAGLVSILSQN